MASTMRCGWAAGVWAAIAARAKWASIREFAGKLRAALAVFKGGWQALPLLPRMLAKRRDVERIRKLSPHEVRKLILDHRISLKQLMRQAV